MFEPDRINIPARYLDPSATFALDIGKSLIKIAYRPSQNGGELNVHSIETSSGSGQNLVPVCLACIPVTQTASLPDFLRNNVSLPQAGCPGPKLRVPATGVNIPPIKQSLEREFHVRLEVVCEHDCTVGSFLHLYRTVPAAELLCPVEGSLIQQAAEEALRVTRHRLTLNSRVKSKRISPADLPPPDVVEILMNLEASTTPPDVLDSMLQLGCSLPYNRDDVFPCMVVSIGTTVSCLKLCKDGSMSVFDISRRSGATFLGLGRLLAGAKSYEDLVMLAERGSSRNVHSVFSDLHEGDDKPRVEGCVPVDHILACFAKSIDIEPDKFSPEDLAASVLSSVVNDVVQTAILSAQAAKCRHVTFCGTFLSHPHVRKTVATQAMVQNALASQDSKMPFSLLKAGSHMGAVGALMGVDGTEKDRR